MLELAAADKTSRVRRWASSIAAAAGMPSFVAVVVMVNQIWRMLTIPVVVAFLDMAAGAPGRAHGHSVDDLALYLQMMMNGQDDVLSADGKALLMRPASPASPSCGLGWFIDAGNGTVWHSGSTPGFGETTQLRNGVTAAPLDLDYDGEGSRWSQQALFIGLILLPVGYLSSGWPRPSTSRPDTGWGRRGPSRRAAGYLSQSAPCPCASPPPSQSPTSQKRPGRS